jgi:KipI family sensor histidine kinase inhibitor
MMTDSVMLQPIGDAALLVRFDDTLSDAANRRAIAFAADLAKDPLEGVAEVAPGLVSVLLRLHRDVDRLRLGGEIRLRLGRPGTERRPVRHDIAVSFDGEDLHDVAEALGLSPKVFVTRHNSSPLRVLAVGFAPGFVYCGFHAENLVVPRRELVRPMVPAGTVLFAAGQTAITATPIRTGWHVIGTTPFQNFDPGKIPPTRLAPGDEVTFVRTA